MYKNNNSNTNHNYYYYRVNFKKNEKNYEVNQSEVFKMVQEADKEPKDLETGKPKITCLILYCHVIIINYGFMKHLKQPRVLLLFPIIHSQCSIRRS